MTLTQQQHSEMISLRTVIIQQNQQIKELVKLVHGRPGEIKKSFSNFLYELIISSHLVTNNL